MNEEEYVHAVDNMRIKARGRKPPPARPRDRPCQVVRPHGVVAQTDATPRPRVSPRAPTSSSAFRSSSTPTPRTSSPATRHAPSLPFPSLRPPSAPRAAASCPPKLPPKHPHTGPAATRRSSSATRARTSPSSPSLPSSSRTRRRRRSSATARRRRPPPSPLLRGPSPQPVQTLSAALPTSPLAFVPAPGPRPSHRVFPTCSMIPTPARGSRRHLQPRAPGGTDDLDGARQVLHRRPRAGPRRAQARVRRAHAQGGAAGRRGLVALLLPSTGGEREGGAHPTAADGERPAPSPRAQVRASLKPGVDVVAFQCRNPSAPAPPHPPLFPPSLPFHPHPTHPSHPTSTPRRASPPRPLRALHPRAPRRQRREGRRRARPPDDGAHPGRRHTRAGADTAIPPRGHTPPCICPALSGPSAPAPWRLLLARGAAERSRRRVRLRRCATARTRC